MGREYNEARKRANEKWSKEHYARLGLAIPKELREELRAAAKAEGMSVNAFIRKAIEEKIKSI